MINHLNEANPSSAKPPKRKVRSHLPELAIVIVVAAIGATAFFWPSPKDVTADASSFTANTNWSQAEPIELETTDWSTAPLAEAPAAAWPSAPTGDASAEAKAIQERLEKLNSLTDTQAQAMGKLLGDLESQRAAQQEQAQSINKLSEALTLLAQRPEPEENTEAVAQQEQVVAALYDLKAALDQAQQRTERSEEALIAMTQRLESLERQARQSDAPNEKDEATARTISELRGQIDAARQDESEQWKSLNSSIGALESRLASLTQQLEEQPKTADPTQPATSNKTTQTSTQKSRTQTPRTKTEIEKTNDRHAPILTQVVIKLLNGNYVEATGYFSPEHRQRVTADGIADAMDGIALEAGRYAGMVSYQRLPMDLGDGSSAYRVVARTTRHRKVSFTITINSDDKVAGLFARIVR